MRLGFDISNYEKVYDVLVRKLGYGQDVFVTDDVIEIDKEDFSEITNALPDVIFRK